MKKLLVVLTGAALITMVRADIGEVTSSLISTVGSYNKVLTEANKVNAAKDSSTINSTCTLAQDRLVDFVKTLAGTVRASLSLVGVEVPGIVGALKEGDTVALIADELNKLSDKLGLGLPTQSKSTINAGSVATLAYLLSTKLPSGALDFTYNGKHYDNYKALYNDYSSSNADMRKDMLTQLGKSGSGFFAKLQNLARPLRFNLYRGTKVFLKCSPITQLADMMNSTETSGADSVDF